MLDLGLFGSSSAANDWLRKRQQEEIIRFFARFRIKEREKQCKPDYYFCSADVRFKLDNLRHEAYLTEFLSLYWKKAQALKRGIDVDQELLADAEMTIGGTKYLVELDTGKMTHKQLKGRFKKLSAAKDTILFVTLGRKRRLEGILRTAAGYGMSLVAASFADVYKNPLGKVWHQPGGGKLLGLELPPDLPPEEPVGYPSQQEAS